MAREFQDPYTYPGTSVLRNLPGLRSERSLRAFEYEAAAARSDQLRLAPVAGAFDLAHLRSIHRHLFQDVYTG